MLSYILVGELPLSIIKMKTEGVNVTLSGNSGFTLPLNVGELGDIEQLNLSRCSLTGLCGDDLFVKCTGGEPVHHPLCDCFDLALCRPDSSWNLRFEGAEGAYSLK